jgi:hypothetical protein
VVWIKNALELLECGSHDDYILSNVVSRLSRYRTCLKHLLFHHLFD